MRIDLKPDHTDFVKQVAAVRADLNNRIHKPGLERVIATMMQTMYVPFLAALRAELRDEVVPQDILAAISRTIAEIATTTIHSLYDAPREAQIEGAAEIMDHATKCAIDIIEGYERVARDAAKLEQVGMPTNEFTTGTAGNAAQRKPKAKLGVIDGGKK